MQSLIFQLLAAQSIASEFSVHRLRSALSNHLSEEVDPLQSLSSLVSQLRLCLSYVKAVMSEPWP